VAEAKLPLYTLWTHRGGAELSSVRKLIFTVCCIIYKQLSCWEMLTSVKLSLSFWTVMDDTPASHWNMCHFVGKMYYQLNNASVWQNNWKCNLKSPMQSTNIRKLKILGKNWNHFFIYKYGMNSWICFSCNAVSRGRKLTWFWHIKIVIIWNLWSSTLLLSD
jgi:hypothetical protein